MTHQAIETGPRTDSSFGSFLRSNWTIPLTLLLLIPLDLLVHSDAIDNYARRIILLIGVNIILAVSLQLINGTSGQFSLGHAGFMAIGAYLSAYPMKHYAGGGSNPASVLMFYLGLAAVVAIAGIFLLVLLRLIRWSGKIWTQLPAILLLMLAIWFLWDISGAARTIGRTPDYFVWTRSFHGLAGLFDLIANGWHGFAMSVSLGQPICFLLVILGGGACASVAGLVIGLPTLRLRGDYLAIATLGFAEIIRVVINNSAPLGGATGMVGIPRLTNFWWLYAWVIVTTVVVWRIANSATGRTLIAVREDEIAAASVGIDNTRYRVLAFLVGAFFAGVGGALYAHLNTYLNPNEFGFMKSVELVVMVTLGGLGSISGAIFTAGVLTLLPEVLRGFAEWRMVLYSLLLIVMMLIRPQGLLGSQELWPPSKWRRKARLRGRGFEVMPSPTTDT
jgi:branched-chain amino acid transport system permease protein